MLNYTKYLIREEVSFLKLSDRYNIFNPENNEQIGYAFENISLLIKLPRLLINKAFLPTRVEVRDNHENLVLVIKKSPVFFRARVDVLDSKENAVGYFKSRLFSLGGRFDVFDVKDKKVAEVKGDWKGWNFKFIGNNQNEIGVVTKQWAGIGKELFTSADNYIISINEKMQEPVVSLLLLAAGLAIDVVYKEKK
jgi:uncharacterized protein YxjI